MVILFQIFTLIRKEFLLDFRDRNPIFSLLLYLVGTSLICYLSFVLKTNKIDSITWNALFWINIFFVSQISVAKSFFGEHKDRNFYYAFVAKPEAVIISKIIYNFISLFILCGLSYVVFSLFFYQEVESLGWFIVNLALGSLALSAGQSLLAATASKAQNNATLLAVLSVPIISPLLLFLVRISNNSIDGLANSLIIPDLLSLGTINLIIITVSYFLFPYLWRS